MHDLQVFTACYGGAVLSICGVIAAFAALRARIARLRQKLRQAKAENARLRSMLQLSHTECDILNGRMEMDREKHGRAVALMAQEAGERYRTKDLLLRQKWQEVTHAEA